MQAPSGFHERRLSHDDLDPDPIVQFRSWLSEADRAQIPLPNAMGLATADAEGRPSVRHVLLRGLDERGFAFFTNHTSRKGRELAENPHAAIVFLWKELDRQVSASGSVSPLSREESAVYFASRPRAARIGAWASRQSAVLGDREELQARVAAVEARFPADDVPLPEFWGGFVLRPEWFEFWQGRESRLHDRFRYAREQNRWHIERLYP